MTNRLPIISIGIAVAVVTLAAVSPVINVTVRQNGQLSQPTNFFSANSNALNAAIGVVPGAGTVTSVGATSQIAGLGFSGGPVTGSGTLVLTGAVGSGSGSVTSVGLTSSIVGIGIVGSPITSAGSLGITGVVGEASIDSAIMRDAEAAAAYQPLNTNLNDLADGSLTGSKVGPGINGDNITAGTVADARIDSAIARDAEVAAGYQPLSTNLSALASSGSTGAGAFVRASAPTIDSAVLTGITRASTSEVQTLVVTNLQGVIPATNIDSAIARLASPALTGTPTAPTATDGASNSVVATTEFVMRNRGAGGGSGDVVGPASAASNNLPAFASTTGKLLKDSGVPVTNLMTVTAANATFVPITASTPTVMQGAGLSNQVFFGAPTIYAGSTSVLAEVGLKAPLASPTFTGTPAAPTPSSGDNSTKLATTAWAQQEFDREAFADRWEEVVCELQGGNDAATLYPWVAFGIGSGTLTAYGDFDSIRSGVVALRTRATADLNTGIAFGQANSSTLLTNTVIATFDLFFSATNDVVARYGFTDDWSTTEPVDGMYLSMTNNRIYGVCLSNSVKSVTSSGVIVPKDIWTVCGVFLTNGVATFRVRTNGVVMWSDSLTGKAPIAAGRQTQFQSSVWGSGTSTTNGTALVWIDRIYYKRSRQNR